jgi:hypothetical protein
MPVEQFSHRPGLGFEQVADFDEQHGYVVEGRTLI